MPESKGRKKKKSTVVAASAGGRSNQPNPVWFVPMMLTLMVVGLLWVVTYYISGVHQFPIPQIGRWNLGVGFGLMMAGFLMTTRWR